MLTACCNENNIGIEMWKNFDKVIIVKLKA